MKNPANIVHKLQNRFRKIPVSLADELIQEHRQEAAFADRVCLATGIERNTGVMTADRIWTDIALPIRVHAIR